MATDVRDLELRRRALEHVRELSRRYDDIVPRKVLLEGFPTPLGRVSYHQHRFRENVLRAYSKQCAIHHLAYDRNLLGIAPDGVVHIASRLLAEIDGPMLRVGLQGFHASSINQPRDRRDRPDPDRLRTRFDRFRDVAQG